MFIIIESAYSCLTVTPDDKKDIVGLYLSRFFGHITRKRVHTFYKNLLALFMQL